MKQIKNSLHTLGIFAIGVVSHHYGGKLLSYKEDKQQAMVEMERDDKMNDILLGVNRLVDKSMQAQNTNLDYNNNIPKEYITKLEQAAKSAADRSKSIIEHIKNTEGNQSDKEELIRKIKDMDSHSEVLSNLIKEIKDKGYKFNDNGGSIKKNGIDLEFIYDYLDNLSIIQESSLLHIIIFCVLIISIFSIITVLFSNEIINYFKLDIRLPRLCALLTLRKKIQRYYITWHVSVMILISIIGLTMNILALYVFT